MIEHMNITYFDPHFPCCSSEMNGPKASNAVETNDKLFGPYARKLESDHFETYNTFSERLAKWLADERAYYPAARPKVYFPGSRYPDIRTSDFLRTNSCRFSGY